jgi:hypothetical protein
MPFGIHKHSNRSKQALNDISSSSGTGSPPPTTATTASEPSLNYAAADEARAHQSQFSQQQQQQQQQQQRRLDPQIQNYGAASRPEPEQVQRAPYVNPGELPARSQSARFPGASYQQEPEPNLQAGVSADDLVLESQRLQPQDRNPGPPGQLPVVEQKKSKSIFDRMRSNRDSKLPATTIQSTYSNTSALSRRLSKRADNPPAIRTQQRNSVDQNQILTWQAQQGQSQSQPPLSSPQEDIEDEGELDPYLITDPGHLEPLDTATESERQQQYHNPQTIRPVPNDSEEQVYSASEDRHHYFNQQQAPPSPGRYQHPESSQHHYQHSNPGNQLDLPQSLPIHDQHRQQNPETVSQLSFDSPVEQRDGQRPISVQSNDPSPTSGYSVSRQQDHPPRITSVQGPRPLSQHTTMGPPSGASQAPRRPGEAKQPAQPSTQGQPENARDGPPPSYGQQFPGNQSRTPAVSPLPPPVSGQGPNYRGGPPQRDQFAATGAGDQGRSTPPPAPGERDVNDAYKELCKFESAQWGRFYTYYMGSAKIQKSQKPIF